jgi:hydroxyacylglutathione hydrolase
MLDVRPIPAFRDNYIWMIRGGADPRAVAVVDPGDAAPVFAVLEREGLALAAILATHHHADHVGGVAALMAATGARAFGPARERMPAGVRPLGAGDRAEIAGLGLDFEVLDVPGHTAGHIAYAGHGTVFPGDTLFSAGCGRLFEGTPDEMLGSLDRLAALPGETRVFCGHEYTETGPRDTRRCPRQSSLRNASILFCEAGMKMSNPRPNAGRAGCCPIRWRYLPRFAAGRMFSDE